MRGSTGREDIRGYGIIIVIVARVVIVQRQGSPGGSSRERSSYDSALVIGGHPQHPAGGGGGGHQVGALRRPGRRRRGCRRRQGAPALRGGRDRVDVVTDGVLGRGFHLDLVAGRQEGVKPGDEQGMPFEQLRYSIDHSGRVDAKGWTKIK